MIFLQLIEDTSAQYPGLNGVRGEPGKPLTAKYTTLDVHENIVPSLKRIGPAKANGNRRLCVFPFSVVNSGDSAALVGTAWQYPERYGVLFTNTAWGVGVIGHYNIQIFKSVSEPPVLTAQGFSRFADEWAPANTPFPIVQKNVPFNAVLNPNRAISYLEPLFSGHYFDGTNLADGEYTMRYTVDPSNWWGQTHSVDVKVKLDVTDFKYIP